MFPAVSIRYDAPNISHTLLSLTPTNISQQTFPNIGNRNKRFFKLHRSLGSIIYKITFSTILKKQGPGFQNSSNESKYIYTCKDAIQCRPLALGTTPPLYRILLANRFQNIYLFGILRTNDYIWSVVFFWISKIKDPFLGNKTKTYRKKGEKKINNDWWDCWHRKQRSERCRRFPSLISRLCFLST